MPQGAGSAGQARDPSPNAGCCGLVSPRRRPGTLHERTPMAEAPTAHAPRETKTLQVARFIVRHRFPISLALIAVTLFFLYPIANTVLTAVGRPVPGPQGRIDTNARSLFPEHPFIHAQDKFGRVFGSSSLVAIALVTDQPTVFTPETIGKISEITKRLDGIGFDSQSDARDELRDQLDEENSAAEEAGQSPPHTPEEIRLGLDRRFPPYPVKAERS